MSAPRSGEVSRRGRGRYVIAGVAALPLIEIVLAMAVASRIGWGTVFLIILTCMLAGTVVIRRGTPRAWGTIRELSGRGPTPQHHRWRSAGTDQVYPSDSARTSVGIDLTNDVLLLLAGLGLVFPGLLSAVLGLLLLIPGVRRFMAPRLAAGIAARTQGRVNRMMASGQAVIITEVGGIPGTRRGTPPQDAGTVRFDPDDPPEDEPPKAIQG